MIVVSYFTPSYKHHAEALRASLVGLGLKHHVVAVDDLGDPRANILRKPRFLRECLEKLAPEPIVWIDADAVVRTLPTALLEAAGHDIGVYSRRGRQDPWAGTIYLAQTPGARKILDSWVTRCARRPELLDQVNLRFAIWSDNPHSRVLSLTKEYCWVERLMRHEAPDAEAVIEHLAASLPDAPEALQGIPTETLVSCYQGLGDSFYMRPAIRRLAKAHGRVHVASPWPQLWKDEKGVVVVKPQSVTLRTQRANLSRTPSAEWAQEPEAWLRTYKLKYGTEEFRAGTPVVEAFMKSAHLDPKYGPEDFFFDADPAWAPAWTRSLARPLGIVRAPTVRREWSNTSRNPDTLHFQAIVDAFPQIRWISLGWKHGGEEWEQGPPITGNTIRLEHGELTTLELLGLVRSASIVVASPCFILPMALAVRTPIFCIFGGSVPPEYLIDPRMGGCVDWVAPEPFCSCFQMTHACNKEIHVDVLSRFRSFFLQRVAA